MPIDLNQCNFIGRLGKEIECRFMPNGKAVVSNSIACADDYKDQNDQIQKRTNWVNIVAFGRTAEIMRDYCKKGSRIFVSGKFTVRKWQDQSGADKYQTEVVVETIQLLDSIGGQGGQQGDQQQGYGQQAPQQHRQHPAPQQAPQQQYGGQQQQDGWTDDWQDDIPF